jgi:integrase
MPPEVIDYLKPVVKKCKADDYLFPTLRHDLPKRFRAAARRAGINTNLTLHDLRHVCGSLLMMSGGWRWPRRFWGTRIFPQLQIFTVT